MDEQHWDKAMLLSGGVAITHKEQPMPNEC